jgi:hypothetical protein
MYHENSKASPVIEAGHQHAAAIVDRAADFAETAINSGCHATAPLQRSKSKTDWNSVPSRRQAAFSH